MMILVDTGLNFYSALSPPLAMTYIKFTNTEILCLGFTLKYIRSFKFLSQLINLNYICHDYRYWSKILFSTIPIPGHDLQVKVIDLEFLY